MTFKDWEKELNGYLKELPDNEREEVLEYYRESYGDRLDAGFESEQILREFGFPKDCADRIIAETAEKSTEANDGENARASTDKQGGWQEKTVEQTVYICEEPAKKGTSAQATDKKSKKVLKIIGFIAACFGLFVFAVCVAACATNVVITATTTVTATMRSIGTAATLTALGTGLIEIGLGVLFLAGLTALCGLMVKFILKLRKAFPADKEEQK